MSQYQLFQTLHLTGVVIYGLTAISCWLALTAAKSLEANHQRMGKFLALGPVLGLSLGALILGGLGEGQMRRLFDFYNEFARK